MGIRLSLSASVLYQYQEYFEKHADYPFPWLSSLPVCPSAPSVLLAAVYRATRKKGETMLLAVSDNWVVDIILVTFIAGYNYVDYMNAHANM